MNNTTFDWKTFLDRVTKITITAFAASFSQAYASNPDMQKAFAAGLVGALVGFIGAVGYDQVKLGEAKRDAVVQEARLQQFQAAALQAASLKNND